MHKQSGFSLLELVFTLGAVGIVTAFAVPQVSDYITHLNKLDAQRQLVLDLRKAQLEARARNCRVIVSSTNAGHSYEAGCDYPPLSDSAPASIDEIIFSKVLPENISVNFTQQVIFSQRGEPIDIYGVPARPHIVLNLEIAGQPPVTFAAQDYYSGGAFRSENT